MHHVLVATGLGAGFSPWAPGTAGALLATLMWGAGAALLSCGTLQVVTLVCIVVFGLLGVHSTNVLEPYWGEDPQRVVVDEMVGVWIPLLVASPNSLWQVAAAFVLFRLFDIFKPLGIRRMESLKGGIGVMMDDVLAGVYSLLIILVLKWAIG